MGTSVSLPTLTVCVMTYRRAHYALMTLYALRERLHYAGKRRFLVVDMGSETADLKMYQHALRNTQARIRSDASLNLASAYNMAATLGGDVWLTCLDDFELQKPIDVTPEVELLSAYPQIGQVRLAVLAGWSYSLPGVSVYGRMVRQSGYHYWTLDKQRSNAPHACIMAAELYHRRFWDVYGDIPADGNPMPGECELRGANRFTAKVGPTIAWPVRYGEGETEPFRHIGYCRSEDYAERSGDAWGAIDVLDSPTIGNVRVA
jgi:hypothetical protein